MVDLRRLNRVLVDPQSKLQAIKARYDPDNVCRGNANVKSLAGTPATTP